jgi:alpha-L-arabinofuranosidase B-like protein
LTSHRALFRVDRDSLAFWVLLGAAVIALVVLVTLTLTPRREAGEPLEARASPFDFGSMPALAPPPSPPISMEPLELPAPSALDPSSAPPADLVSAPRPTDPVSPSSPRSGRTQTPSKPATRTPAAPVWEAWLGKRVALEVGGQAGMLLRHQNFVAQVAPIGSASRALDRADATFVLRPGLSGSGCLSFEASNYKGFYLRHKNFVLQLMRDDKSSLFRSDATFCPEPASGGSLTLRATNFPGHRLTLQWYRVALSPVSAGQAMHVRLRPPP